MASKAEFYYVLIYKKSLPTLALGSMGLWKISVYGSLVKNMYSSKHI